MIAYGFFVVEQCVVSSQCMLYKDYNPGGCSGFCIKYILHYHLIVARRHTCQGFQTSKETGTIPQKFETLPFQLAGMFCFKE